MGPMDKIEPSAASRAEAYAARVDAALADLPPDQRSKLTHGLAAHLTEPGDSGVPLIDELGTPQEYAAELRSTLPTVTPAPAPAGVNRRWPAIVVVAVALLAVLLPAMWFGAILLFRVFEDSSTGQQTAPTSVPAPPSPAASVPNLVGLPEQDAVTQLNSAGLLLGSVTSASSGTVPKGVVMAMAPAAGSQVPAGSTVDLTLSSGPAS